MDEFSTVGEQHRIALRRWRNVAVRFSASENGLPSDPAEVGHLSSSSQNRYRMARRARLPGDPAEVIASRPPLNHFTSIVLSDFRAFESDTLPAKHGTSRSMGAMRSFEKLFASA